MTTVRIAGAANRVSDFEVDIDELAVMDERASNRSCVFCGIIEGRVEATFLHRDERCAVFMDIRPVNPGHLLIIPNDHSRYMSDVEPETLAHMMGLARRFAAGLRRSGIRCEGINLFLADGEAAMQEVPHCHLHVFPRYVGDGFGLRFGPDYVTRSRAELEATADLIRAGLDDRAARDDDGSGARPGPACELMLRPWVEADAPGFREAVDDDVAHLRPWLSWTLEEPSSLEATRRRLATWVEQFRTGQACRYAITALHSPSVILGGVGLNTRVGPGAHDLSYWVRKSAARQGVAWAAVAALVVDAFDRRGVNRLVIHCDVANEASAAFARHLGFVYVGPAERPCPDGSPRPLLEFDMVLETYLRDHAPAFRERARRVQLTQAAFAVDSSFRD